MGILLLVAPKFAMRLVRRPAARDALVAAKPGHVALGALFELVLRAAAQAARSRHLARARAAPVERLGLGQLALRIDQPRQVVDGDERARVVRAEQLLAALERAPAQRLGLGQPALRLEQHRQVADGGERARVLRAELLLLALERAAVERLGLGELALRLEQPAARLLTAMSVCRCCAPSCRSQPSSARR